MGIGYGIWKKYCHIWNQCLLICLVAKFGAKLKFLKFGIKYTWFGWAFFDWNLKTILSYLKSSPRIGLTAKCREIIKMDKFGTKNASFCYFWGRIFKKLFSYCISKQHPKIGQFAKFCEKTIMSKKWDPKCLIWVFLGKNFKKILSYLKSVPSNWSNCIISWNDENV